MKESSTPPITRTVATAYGPYTYILTYKRIKNVNLHVKPEHLVISAPFNTPLTTIDSFVMQKAAWISKAQNRIQKQSSAPKLDPSYTDGETFLYQGKPLQIVNEFASHNAVFVSGDTLHIATPHPTCEETRVRIVRAFMKEQCLTQSEAALKRLLPALSAYRVPIPTLKARYMKSQWGSCHTVKHIITMNSRLMHAPQSCTDYVMAHELCHLVHANHSSAFYQLLNEVYPTHREQKKLLAHFTSQ